MRFLIVDDMQECRELAAAFLKTLFDDLDVTEVDSGQAAIAVLSEDTRFDMIICDFTMPNGTGARVFQFLVEQSLKIPFILFSALSDHDLSQFQGPAFVGVAAKHDLEQLEQLVTRTITALSPMGRPV